MAAEQQQDFLPNPFAFPPETKGRFALLVVAALALGANLGYFLLDAVRKDPAPQEILGSMAYHGRKPRIINLSTISASDLEKFGRMRAAKAWPALLNHSKLLILPCLSTFLVGIIAFVIYRGQEEGLIRRHCTWPLTKINAPVVVADLEKIATRFGVPLPRLEWRKGLAQGHAFGTKGREVLLLHGTPEILEKSWGGPSQAIALHELAHVVNGDAAEREKARAIWNALLILLVPVFLFFWAFAGLEAIWLNAAKVLVVLVVVRVIWAGLIRVREHYADWRAVSWGVRPALERLLTLSEDESGPWERWQWWWHAWACWGDRAWWRVGCRVCDAAQRKWGWLLRLHPTFKARRKVLSDSRSLFRISAELSFITGLLLTFVFSGFFRLVGDAAVSAEIGTGYFYHKLLLYLARLPVGDLRNYLLLAAGVVHFYIVPILVASVFLSILSFLTTGSLGMQVKRQATIGMLSADSWGYLRLFPHACLFAVGMEVGLSVSPFNELATNRGIWLMVLLWITLHTVIIWFWLAYVHGLSRFLFGSFVGFERPVLRDSLVSFASASLLTVLYWPAALARLTVQAIPLIETGALFPQFDEEIRRVFVNYFLVALFGALISAALLYMVWVLITIVGVWLWVIRRKLNCPSCRQVVSYLRPLGCRCGGCGSNLTPWLLPPDIDSGVGGGGR